MTEERYRASICALAELLTREKERTANLSFHLDQLTERYNHVDQSNRRLSNAWIWAKRLARAFKEEDWAKAHILLKDMPEVKDDE